MKTTVNKKSQQLLKDNAPIELFGRCTALGAKSRYSVPGLMIGELPQRNPSWLMILHRVHARCSRIFSSNGPRRIADLFPNTQK